MWSKILLYLLKNWNFTQCIVYTSTNDARKFITVTCQIAQLTSALGNSKYPPALLFQARFLLLVFTFWTAEIFLRGNRNQLTRNCREWNKICHLLSKSPDMKEVKWLVPKQLWHWAQGQCFFWSAKLILLCSVAESCWLKRPILDEKKMTVFFTWLFCKWVKTDCIFYLAVNL